MPTANKSGAACLFEQSSFMINLFTLFFKKVKKKKSLFVIFFFCLFEGLNVTRHTFFLLNAKARKYWGMLKTHYFLTNCNAAVISCRLNAIDVAAMLFFCTTSTGTNAFNKAVVEPLFHSCHRALLGLCCCSRIH